MQTSLDPMVPPSTRPVEGPSVLRRAHDAAVGYHLLVGLLFTACLPVSLARNLGGKAQAGPFAGALDTARDAAAQAFSLPG